MGKRKIQRTPAFKQMAFETAVRNPERYLEIFTALIKFEGKILSDENLLEIISTLYLKKIVTSKEIIIEKNTTLESIKVDVIKVNNSRRADGGFPSGYASRFWTYMRTPSELGFVYARYNEPLKFSIIAKKFIEREIDVQEAFSIQTMKHNRKNPYKNVSNDFNFFRFLITVLLELQKENKSLSYEQFILAMFNENGNTNEFLEVINNNKFPNFSTVYHFIQENFHITTNEKTATKDYPDVLRRVFIISGFITIRYVGKKLIQINKNKLAYIKELLDIEFRLNNEEKFDAKKYFEKLDSVNQPFIKLIKKYRKDDVINGNQYLDKIFNIIKDYEINENIIIESIKKIGSRNTIIEEFKEIPEPLKLEFFISILIALKYGKEFAIKPNYKADHIGKPYSHAPGNKGDIEVFSRDIYWLIEVTLIRNKTQQLNNETTSVIRHLYSNEEFKDIANKYLSFIAPVIHEDTRAFFNYSVVQRRSKEYIICLKPYSIDEFVDITIDKNNFNDMAGYTQSVYDDFKTNLI